MSERFDDAAKGLSQNLFSVLYKLPPEIKKEVQEIRVRVNKPLALSIKNKTLFVTQNSELTQEPQNAVAAAMSDIAESFQNICCYSVYSHQNEIKNGFITMRCGHRVGLCGTAVISNGKITSVRDISSLNVRIARQIKNAAQQVMQRIGKINGGVLICGAPCSGKTTILRDMAKRISQGIECESMRTCVVDERGELSGTYSGIAKNDLGISDILNGYPKGEGIMQSLRALSPEVIICDEIGAQEDISAVEQGLNSGVYIIATVHASSYTELLKRKQALNLIETGAFNTVVMLSSRASPGEISEIVRLGR